MPELFKIKVKTLEGAILIFRNVSSYDASEGFIKFVDVKNGVLKIFPVSSCEISLEDKL